ncbi:MAG: tetratricopeptide repeat protein [Pyrinomonadaceae bacterium]|nr:tetratricopeptide repeat protein [Pyrinomonadaceae bacterium]
MYFSKLVKNSLALLAIAFILSEPTFQGRPRSVLLTAFAESSGTEQGTDGIHLPAPGESTTQELSAGEFHSYRITLETNQYLHALVEQHGMEAGVTLYEPSGRILVQLDCRHYGPTPVSLIAETTGTYRMEVRSLEREHVRGRYELKAEEIRPSTEKDKYRIAAEKSFAEAEQLLEESKAESIRRAVDKFKASLPAWKAAGDRREEALSLKRIGESYQPLGEYQSSLTFYNQSLSISRQIRDRKSEGEILNDLSIIYLTLGDVPRATYLCSQALKLSRATGNLHGEAQALNNFGEVHYGLGELQQSVDLYQQALPLWRKLGDRRGQALTLLNFGYSYSDMGKMSEAFNAYAQALLFWRTINNLRGQAATLTAIGRLYSRMGESQEALGFFDQAMRIAQAVGDPIEQARILNGIAYIYDQLGEKQKAIGYYNQALSLFRAARYSNGEASTLHDIGRAYYSLGDNQQALDYYQQALSISRAAGDRRLEFTELRDIGKVYDSLGDKAKALDAYLRALSFWRSERDLRAEVDTLNPIGLIFEARGQKQKALEYYEKALPLSRTAKYRYGETATLLAIARVERDSGHLMKARDRAEEALVVVESLREKVDSQDLRASYFASVRQPYEFYIDLLMRLHVERPSEGFDAAAFEASERARARSLLETLSVARVGVRRRAEPALLERESKLSKELNDKAARRMNLAPASKQDDPEALMLAKEIDDLAWQLREVEAQIRAGSMEQTASLETRPLGLKAIQDRVVSDETLLLEYSLGEERSFLWAITRETIFAYELPRRAEIEELARGVYDSLTANQLLPGEPFVEQQARVAMANEQLPSQIGNLSKILLAPVADKLRTKRLLIVADGALQYIPFQVLTKPTTPNLANNGEKAAEPRPLVADHEIVNQSSASALAVLMGDTSRRKQPSNSVAVFADPVFEADDPRITSGSVTTTDVLQPPPSGTESDRALRDVGLIGNGTRIPRLRASQDEADAIMTAAPWWSGFKAIGFQASRATALRSDLGDYRIIHFATHGFLNDEHPELSGVVLSLFDEKGQSQEGFLRLHDIYNLNLPVDLVVLSACNTGLGKEVKGEGLIGLTRGFMYAGASSVVASLWKVDDEATAELMRLFYGFMLRDGLSPAAALRKAQVTMSQQKRRQSPYFWAGFVIQGQYLQSERSSRLPIPGLALWAVAAAVLSAAGIYALRRRRKTAL